jgi:hypothetical protein
MALVKDIVIDQGETLVIDFLWRDKETQTPIDLAGCSIYLQARAEKASTSPLLIDASTVNGKIVIGTPSTDGEFTLTLSATYTSGLTVAPEPLAPAKRAYFELVIVTAGGVLTKLRKGNIIFNSSVYYP